MQIEYTAEMTVRSVIPEMYAESSGGLTQTARGRHYNAAMTSSGASGRSPHPYLTDSILALALTILITFEAAGNRDYGVTGADKLALLFITVPLAWRRREPLTVFAVIISVAVFSLNAAPYTGVCSIMVAAYSVGAYCRYRLASLGALVATAVVIDVVFHGGLPPIPDTAGPFVALIPLWLVGNAMRTRQLRIDASEERAIRLERENELSTRAALAEERARIARELHDVVAHSVSVMVVQAGAARQVLPTSPEEARQALLAVESTGRDAMTELRGLLDVLGDDGGMALAPQPGMEQVDRLVQRVRDAGLPVELHVEGARRPLPVGVDLAAYRIVQEALTNALKFSGLAPTTVVLDYRAEELKLEVLDEGSAVAPSERAEAGRGLAGMRDRVAVYGGSLEAGPRPVRGYAVRAWLPATTS
jgi:signal transduction histidine kinase